MGPVVVNKEAWAVKEKIWAAADEQEVAYLVGFLVADAVQAEIDVVEGVEVVQQAQESYDHLARDQA